MPFTQYTQAATCVCYGRGYVIDGEGDFAACSCQAGETFAAYRASLASGLAPTLSPKAA